LDLADLDHILDSDLVLEDLGLISEDSDLGEDLLLKDLDLVESLLALRNVKKKNVRKRRKIRKKNLLNK
jgi:hypothetical protein